MSFLYKNHSAGYPPGSIIQYIGTTDPDGWIICNGIKRKETDGRFLTLSNLLNTMTPGSTNDSNNCTPPDLSNRFLYGKSDSENIGNMSGSGTKSLVMNNLPSHNHTIADLKHDHGGFTGNHTHSFSGGEHNHDVYDPGHSHSYVRYYELRVQSGGDNNVWTNTFDTYTGNATTGIWLYGATETGYADNSTAPISKGTTGITLGNTGSGTAFDIMPPYYMINYIMKY